MRTVWAVAVAALLILAVEAHADTVYLKGGQSVWGREVMEEGDTVIVVRPGERLRFPKSDVDRIERWRLSVPKYYEPPAADVGTAAESPASTQRTAPAAGFPPPPSEAPAPTRGPAAVTPPAGGMPATAAPVPLTPTLLPPPPPPSADRPRY
jgi:hypothetical protein